VPVLPPPLVVTTVVDPMVELLPGPLELVEGPPPVDVLPKPELSPVVLPSPDPLASRELRTGVPRPPPSPGFDPTEPSDAGEDASG